MLHVQPNTLTPYYSTSSFEARPWISVCLPCQNGTPYLYPRMSAAIIILLFYNTHVLHSKACQVTRTAYHVRNFSIISKQSSVLFKCEELGGSLWSLCQQRRENTLVERQQPAGADTRLMQELTVVLYTVRTSTTAAHGRDIMISCTLKQGDSY